MVDSNKITRAFLSFLYVSINAVCLAGNIFDVEYFQFTGKRLTTGSFSIVQDIEHQLGFIAVDYWYFSLIILAMAGALIWVDKKIPLKPYDKNYSLMTHIGSILVFLMLLVLGGRGGWQMKPIIPAYAFASQQPHLAALSLNSTFTVIKSYNHSPLSRKSYFSNWEEIELSLSHFPVQVTSGEPLLPPNTNIMVIILESFGLEYMGINQGEVCYTPFLAKLAQRGVFYRNHFANGRRSIDVMPSIFAGIPSWMPRPLITSPYQRNKFATLPQNFKGQGYQTLFFHGGENGTMFFDVMADRFGFDNYLGASSYPNPDDYDGRWGIFDEPFLKFTSDTLNKTEKPFFASVFTLSSHHPYTIPQRYHGKFPQGTLEIHQSIGYADYALQQFFSYAKGQDWYNNTLFVITADHTSKSHHSAYQSDEGLFRVPLIFFHPSQPLSFLEPTDLAQHIDIMPTLFDMMGWPTHNQLPRFGQSLLIHQNRHVIINIGDDFKLINNSKNKFVNLLETDKSLATRGQASNEKWRELLKAKVQYYYNGMLEDRLVW